MVAIPHENAAGEEKEMSRKRRRLTWDVASDDPRNRGIKADGKDDKRLKAEVPSRSRQSSPPRRDDDSVGHYVFSLGENLTPRYKILKKLGEGTFGRVLECWDRQTREFVAIKVIRSLEKYRKAAMTEVDVLRRLSENDTCYSHCVQILSWFDYRNHICIVSKSYRVQHLFNFFLQDCSIVPLLVLFLGCDPVFTLTVDLNY
ncbi:unnamed protein product [Cuscuta campestris]|uniref:Protein kinase domain-containing protein n=1 Tax=Cuscuta campestris TaxID=132261 RepID=A0A484M737_9ASTE|nr:unnamed protein product [Cuscuta campestris]